VHLQNDVPGVEVSTGSLGHGLGIGAGLALAAKRDRCAYRTFVLLSDGECHEGSTWESAMFAAHHRLNNLIAIVDRNKLCVTGFIKSIVRLDPFDEKWRSFGWGVVTIDGHSFKEIFRALKPVRRRNDTRPLVVIANTVKGKGVSFMENVPLWHGGVPKGRQVKLAKAELARKA
jgi:transketolase